MNDIQIDKTLYRIIQGRLRFKRDGLVLYIHEPTPEIIYESHEVYDEVYDECYWKGVYVKEEIIPILIENDYWTPLDDREADKLQEQVENKKVDAFKSFVKKRQLNSIKMEIHRKYMENTWNICGHT